MTTKEERAEAMEAKRAVLAAAHPKVEAQRAETGRLLSAARAKAALFHLLEKKAPASGPASDFPGPGQVAAGHEWAFTRCPSQCPAACGLGQPLCLTFHTPPGSVPDI